MNQSINAEISQIFLENPNSVYTTKDLIRIFNSQDEQNTEKRIITTILTRLYRKGLILRTPTQLTDGYYYSRQNNKLLELIYESYLLPYEFQDKSKIISLILKNSFTQLENSHSFELERIKNLEFVKKYGLDVFKERKVQQFLALLVGFSMCDGSITPKLTKVIFYFRLKPDAIEFVKNFKEIFFFDGATIRHASNGESYLVEIKRGAPLAKLLNKLGSSAGNKVFRPFLIPDWIYHGSDEIKKVFLSTVIGNEGSAPSNNRWRIQFVLSKSKEYVPNLLEFLNQIRAMLSHFGITTSHIQLRKQKGRQFHGRFYIKGKENLHKFYNEFSFLYASEKQEVLEELIFTNRREKRDDLVNTR